MSHSIEIIETFSAEAIAARVTVLGREIHERAGGSDVFLLGVLKGASILLSDLMRAIPGEVGYGFIDVIRDESDTETAAALEIDFLSYTNITGRNVYVLKDVVSSGVIENYLLTQLRMRNPASLHLVALLDRPNLRTVEIETDHHAFQVAEGSFVGYGLEHEGKFGNLSYIGRIR